MGRPESRGTNYLEIWRKHFPGRRNSIDESLEVGVRDMFEEVAGTHSV